MKHVPALDGIRAFAVLVVVAQHVGMPGFYAGGMGVDVFFVLSGYLITSLLAGEIERTGNVDLIRFYVRRAKRLSPALLLMLIGLVLVWPGEIATALISAAYLMDYARAFFVGAGPLTHTWSLAVEEHFYLLWAPLIIAAARYVPMRHWWRVLAGLYLVATLWRCVSAGAWGYEITYYRFDTRLSGLVLGALLALVIHHPSRDKILLWVVTAALLIAGGAALVADIGQITLTLLITMTEAVALGVIAVLLRDAEAGTTSSATRWLALPTLAYLGRLSYGIYLFHHPIAWGMEGAHWMTIAVVVLPTSVALAALSYHLIERPILTGKWPIWLGYGRQHREGPRPRTGTAHPVLASAGSGAGAKKQARQAVRDRADAFRPLVSSRAAGESMRRARRPRCRF